MATLILGKKTGGFQSQKLMSFISLLETWMERHHQRKQLAELGVEQLKDMGLDVQQVLLEINKPFWK